MIPSHIVIHCSDSAFGSIYDIDEWHRDRGFARARDRIKPGAVKHCGYHFVITNAHPDSLQFPPVAHADGAIQIGRDEDEIGAHAQSLNGTLGVCLIGKPGAFTPRQLESMRGLVASLALRHEIPTSNVIGHFETPYEQAKTTGRKTCPGLEMRSVRNDIARVIEAMRILS